MSQHSISKGQPQLSRALGQMVEALEILDELNAPGDIGSLLDLAIVRLGTELGLDHHGTTSVEALLARLGADSPAMEAELGNSASPWDIAPV